MAVRLIVALLATLVSASLALTEDESRVMHLRAHRHHKEVWDAHRLEETGKDEDAQYAGGYYTITATMQEENAMKKHHRTEKGEGEGGGGHGGKGHGGGHRKKHKNKGEQSDGDDDSNSPPQGSPEGPQGPQGSPEGPQGQAPGNALTNAAVPPKVMGQLGVSPGPNNVGKGAAQGPNGSPPDATGAAPTGLPPTTPPGMQGAQGVNRGPQAKGEGKGRAAKGKGEGQKGQAENDGDDSDDSEEDDSDE